MAIIGGLDPYETVRSEWLDDMDLWPSVTCVHIVMYLLLTPSPYSGENLVNYRSMDCYVRERKRSPPGKGLLLAVPQFFPCGVPAPPKSQ